MPKRAKHQESETENLGIRTASTASFLISGRFIAIIISAAMFIIVARLLQPYDYGIYVLIMSAAGIVSAIGNPNIGPYLKEKIPSTRLNERAEAVGTALADALFLSIGIGVLLLVMSVALGSLISTYILHTSNYETALYVGLTIILFSLIFSTFNDALLSVGNGAGAAAASILHSTVQAVLSITLVLAGYGIVGALLGFITGLFISSIFEIFLCNKSYPLKFSLKGIISRLRQTLGFSKYLTASGFITGILTNLSTVYLGFIVLPSTVGNYGISQKVLNAIDILVGSIALALIPMFSETKHMKDPNVQAGKLFNYSIYLSLLFATPLVVFITVFSHDLILLLFSSSYLGATVYMQLITMSLFASIVFTYGTNYMIGIGEPKKVLKYAMLTGIATLVSMIPLTIYFGVIGTIIAIFYIGNILPSVLYWNYISGHGPRFEKRKITTVMIANLIPGIILCAMAVSGLAPILALIIGAAIYFVLYPVLAAKIKAIEKKDIDLMRKSGAKLPVIGVVLNSLLDYASKFAS